MRPKILISTAWWPTKTACFKRYSEGINAQLGHDDFDAELFITTTFADTKFKSILGSMGQAQEWARVNGFTHVFNVEADKALAPDTLAKLLAVDKPVVYAGRGGGSGVVLVSGQSPGPLERLIGWGVVLVQMGVLERVPFNSYVGDFIWPDYAWWKRLVHSGIQTWINFDAPVETLEPASRSIHSSFQPTTEVHP